MSLTTTLRNANSRTRTRGPGKRHSRHSWSHLFLLILSFYFIIPLWWLLVASTKSNSGLFVGSGGPLWFNDSFDLWENLRGLGSHQNGIYWRWFANSFLYSFSGGIGATVLSVLAGYGFATYRFRGRNLAFSMLLGAVMVPMTALIIPTFMLLSELDMLNTIWAIILPSMLSPIGVYLIRVYAQEAVPDELLDAARVDGAGELRVFAQIALPLLRPAVVTVLLLTVVATWNNFFLPLVMVQDPNLLPVTVGLNNWQALSNAGAGGEQVWNLIVTGSTVSILPLILSFLTLQRYWQGGLSLGSLE